MPPLKLSLLPERLAVCQTTPTQPFPEWLPPDGFWSLTRTSEELSLVIKEDIAPKDWKVEDGWRCLKIEGPLDFNLIGILSSLTEPLAAAGIPVFVISTYDTDYLLIKEENLERTIDVLSKQLVIIEERDD